MAEISDIKIVEQVDAGKDEKLQLDIWLSPFHSTSDLRLYTIMSRDTLGLILSHIKLKADNYEQCATLILTSMREKRKECFIDGIMKWSSHDSPEVADWVTMNSLIVQGFFNIFDTSIISSVPYMADAQELWDHLEKHFFAWNGPWIYELREIANKMVRLFFITTDNSLTCERN